MKPSAPRRKTSLLCFAFAALNLLCMPTAAQASNITQGGLFTQDNSMQLFDLVVAAPGSIDVRSYGYAGGTTSTGTAVPRGGFDTVLTLFSATGNILVENDDGAGVAIDSPTGQASDARLTTSLTTGSYIVALTQYDNFAAGTSLANGFVEAGHPNFTADPGFATGGACPGNLFRDTSGTAGQCRSGNWTVDFLDVASVTPRTPVPEPSATSPLGLSLVGLAWAIRKIIQKNQGISATFIAFATHFALACSARAQSAFVSQRQRIGLLGNSGSTTAPHLYFQAMDSPSALKTHGLPFVSDKMRLQGEIADSVNKAGEKFSDGIPLPIRHDHRALLQGAMPLTLDVLNFK